MADLRLFVACELPEDVRAWVAQTIPRDELPAGRWVPEENLHVTLKFLGPTREERVAEVASSCDVVAQNHRPAQVSLGGVGVFPSLRRASVLWVGLHDEASLLKGLAADLERALVASGYPQEKRTFTPHVTIARWRRPQRLQALPELQGEPPPIDVDAISLMRSRLGPRGSRYELVARSQLASKP